MRSSFSLFISLTRSTSVVGRIIVIIYSLGRMSASALPVKASECCGAIRYNAEPTRAMYEALKDVCENNVTYFTSDSSENGRKLQKSFKDILEILKSCEPLVNEIRKVAPNYDLSPETPGNGYRSFVSVVDSSVLYSLKVGRQVINTRDALLFRKAYYVKEVEACTQLVYSLTTILGHLRTLISWSSNGELFARENHSPDELFLSSEPVKQHSFYGRCLGFQFHPSIRSILKGISICMAGFSEAYYNQGSIINSVFSSGQYVFDPEMRAKRIVHISQGADVHFCKAFWFLAENEILTRVPIFGSPSIAVNKLISIQPSPISAKKNDGTDVSIDPPTVHLGLKGLNVRLISAEKRKGMKSSSTIGPSPGIVFHVHGGGFVAQSSRSHESYLRAWTASIDAPILSVDYSLAPEAPYPRACQEVYFAYCWMLNNFESLGTTGHRIVLAGDSAGANLVAGLTIRIVESGVRRPDGLFLAYAPMLVSFSPSPARLLSLMDPLLPFGFMMRCLKAYACPPSVNDDDKSESKTESLVTVTPADSNGYTKHSITQSQDALTEISATEACALRSSASADTMLSADSLPDNDATPTADRTSGFLAKYVMENETYSADETKNVDNTINGYIKESESNSSTLRADEPGTSSNKQERTTDERKEIRSKFGEAITYALAKFKLSSQASNSLCPEGFNPDGLMVKSPSDEFMFKIPTNDPYLSPYHAEEDILKHFPRTSILSVHLDPCLDDCVMFAKKLRRLGVNVNLDVLEGLPHGFLNFSLMSKEANEGSKLCVKRIKALLNIEDLEYGEEPREKTP